MGTNLEPRNIGESHPNERLGSPYHIYQLCRRFLAYTKSLGPA